MWFTLKLLILYSYDDKGTPINNSLDDIRNLVALLARENWKPRPGFGKALEMFKKMKKKGQECRDLDLKFMIHRKKADVEKTKGFPKFPGL